MRNLILFTLSTLAFLIHPLSLPAQNSFSFSIGENTAAGDQAVTSVNVSPDFDGDGIVGFSDFLAFAGQFGSRQGDGRYEAKYDLDSDGAIGFSDFLIFTASFGKEVSPPDGATQVAIPDTNLRVVIADSLGKASDAPITQAEMATLTRLAASNKNIRDLTGLEFATNLTALDLGGAFVGGEWVNSNEISNLSPLSNLTSLETLVLENNSISDVTPLSNMTRLIRLDLSSNNISNVTPLSNLTSLEWLWLNNNSISNLTGLEFATNLTVLDLGGAYVGGEWVNSNEISNLSPLSNLTSLERLYLDNNSISDVTPLSNLIRLIRLYLDSNNISNVTPLSNMTSLERLVLGNNSISNVTPLSNLTSLEWLGLDSNSISNVTPLSNLTSLEWLGLGNNSISNVTPLSNMTSLERLWLNNNSISDLAPLVANTGLGSGDKVDVSNNPLSATSINIHIPALESRGVEVDFRASKPTVKNKELRMPFRMIEPFGMKKWKVDDNLRKGRLNNF